ncbi:MAG: BACON domain-containing protein [Alistipes onderdonkii]
MITDRASYKGTLFGQCNKAARFSDCIAQGDLGAYEDALCAGRRELHELRPTPQCDGRQNSQNILYYPNGSQVPAEPEFGVNFVGRAECAGQQCRRRTAFVGRLRLDGERRRGLGDVTDLRTHPSFRGRDSGVQYIKIGADANTKTAPRSAVVTFASTDGSKSATVRVDQQARGEAFPSKWVFQASTLPLYGSSWTDDNVIPATSGAAGFISVVRGDANASAAFKRSVVTNRPAVSTMVEGDYWLYTFPVENLAAGSVVDFNATMAGEAIRPNTSSSNTSTAESGRASRRTAHGSGKPGCPLYLQVFGHCHRVLVSARDRHADDAFSKTP